MLSPELLTHIIAATVGLIAGYLAMILRKGSGWHRAAGTVFTASMLLMAGSAVYVATLERVNMLNVTAGLLTMYLVATAWRAPRRKNQLPDAADAIALGSIALVAVGGIVFGFQALTPAGRDGMPAAPFFIFGGAAVLFVSSDVRMFLRRGLTPGQRLGRHLWRMGLALLIASLSISTRQAIFPSFVRDFKLFAVLHVLLIGTLLLWLARLRRTKQKERATVAAARSPEPLHVAA